MKIKDLLPYVLGKVKIFAVDKSEMLRDYAMFLEDYDLDDPIEFDKCEEKYGNKNLAHLRYGDKEIWIVLFN